jgi:hypothetical protein
MKKVEIKPMPIKCPPLGPFFEGYHWVYPDYWNRQWDYNAVKGRCPEGTIDVDSFHRNKFIESCSLFDNVLNHILKYIHPSVDTEPSRARGFCVMPFFSLEEKIKLLRDALGARKEVAEFHLTFTSLLDSYLRFEHFRRQMLLRLYTDWSEPFLTEIMEYDEKCHGFSWQFDDAMASHCQTYQRYFKP